MTWLIEITGVLLIAGGVGYVFPPAAPVLLGAYLMALAYVRGR